MAAIEPLTPLDCSCAHCGLELPVHPPVDASGRLFCCDGCLAVYSVIHELGLERYYQLRQEAAPQPARRGRERYVEFDDAAFLGRYAGAATGGALRITFFLEAMHCAACVWMLEKLRRLIPGLLDLRADLSRQQVALVWDPTLLRLSEIARRLASLGYPPHIARGLERDAARRREDRALLVRMGVSGAIAANVMAISFGLYAGLFDGIEPQFFQLFRWSSLALTLPAFLYGGAPFLRGAWNGIRTRTLQMDVPIAAGLLAGFIQAVVNTARGSGHAYFETLTTLIFLLLVGRWIQRRQQRAAGDATELLAALSPSTGRRLDDAGEVTIVPLEALVVGDRVELLPGETLPADGIVRCGRSSLDRSLLTGESTPVPIAPGDSVEAGAVNVSQRIEVEVRSTGEETRIGRLMKLVEEHALRRAPIVKLADRLAAWLVAAMLLLALFTLLLWWGRSPDLAVNNALSLLMITCPCALGLATPLAVSAAIGQAARAGFLIKGGDALEALAGRSTLMLDKTGTVTEGKMSLTRWDGDPSAQSLFAALERDSRHPVGIATRRTLGESLLAVEQLQETHGGGVSGVVAGKRIEAGTMRFLAAELDQEEWGERLQSGLDEGLTPIFIAVERRLVAIAWFGDRLRDDAVEAVARLRRAGHEPGLLSGDHPAAVSAAAMRLGIPAERRQGGATPEEKLAVVEAQRARQPVVMVGDGVNDAAALAAATVGIAVHGGAEAALSAADIYVARPGVAALADLIDGARRTMRVIRRNIILSLIYNLVGVALAVSGLLNPLIASITMPISSLAVVISSYRAKTFSSSEENYRCR